MGSIEALCVDLCHISGRVEQERKPSDPGEELHLTDFLDILRNLFGEMKPQEEVYLAARVDENGGIHAVEENDNILRDLLGIETNLQASGRKGILRMPSSASIHLETDDTKLRPEMSERTMLDSTIFLKGLKADLSEDWDTAVGNNRDVFQRKFAVLQTQLARDLPDYILRENDRVIQKLTAGPHDGIDDPVRT